MSKNDHPTQCPYCRAAPPPEWFGGQEEWRCESCRTRFVIRRLPWLEKEPEAEKDQRTDLIAKAYRGQLSVDEVLFLVESLMWRARNAIAKNGPVRTAAPHDQPAGPWAGLSAGLEITP